MKLWTFFVLGTILCWGAYVPTIHHGQMAFGSRNSALRAFLFVGVAYFLMSAAVLAFLVLTKAEPLELTRDGVRISTIAGVLGALGALGIVFAMKFGGKPIFVAPVVLYGTHQVSPAHLRLPCLPLVPRLRFDSSAYLQPIASRSSASSGGL